MKYIIVLGDGMSDQPEIEHGGLTPLMAAHLPNIDKLAKIGRSGLLKTIPEKLHPGSEVANLAVLGYDVEAVFEGRGVIEAASIGVQLNPGDLALRCNLICVSNDKIKNHSAGHISTPEAIELIKYLDEELGNENIKFYPGVSYRHLLVIKGGNKSLNCTPPHDVPGTPVIDVLPIATSAQGDQTAQLLLDLIQKSQQLLMHHPINIRRHIDGKDMANSIWPWSPGYKPAMKTLKEMFGIESGAVISAVDLIQGIGVYAGLDVIKVEGATGLYDTNYEGKAQAAIEALKTKQFVYLHIEASDEAGHEGDYDLKVKTIEYLDRRIVKYLVEEIAKMDEPVAIAILPDHPTPWKLKTHTRDAVPFLIWFPGIQPDEVDRYDELSAKKGSYGVLESRQFMQELLGEEKSCVALKNM
jgi:2,3-bisphosphoglycerate-independent phosphoglycerate mutase